MSTGLQKRIVEYMEECRSCTIATASVDGQPAASTVFFKSRGVDIYFNTGVDSQKARNILENPRVAVAMHAGTAPTRDPDIKGIQYIGQGEILADANVLEAPVAVTARHRAFNSAAAGSSVIVKLTPEKIYLVDYSKGFRHRDHVEF